MFIIRIHVIIPPEVEDLSFLYTLNLGQHSTSFPTKCLLGFRNSSFLNLVVYFINLFI